MPGIVGKMIVEQELTTGWEMHSLTSPDLDNSKRATSAADCSAALRLKNPGKELYLTSLTITVDLKEGS